MSSNRGRAAQFINFPVTLLDGGLFKRLLTDFGKTAVYDVVKLTLKMAGSTNFSLKYDIVEFCDDVGSEEEELGQVIDFCIQRNWFVEVDDQLCLHDEAVGQVLGSLMTRRQRQNNYHKNRKDSVNNPDKKTKKKAKPLTIAEKKKKLIPRYRAFEAEVREIAKQKAYPAEMVKRFLRHWGEPNKPLTKMGFELQNTWDTAGRLQTWADRNKDFKRKGTSDEVSSDDFNYPG